MGTTTTHVEVWKDRDVTDPTLSLESPLSTFDEIKELHFPRRPSPRRVLFLCDRERARTAQGGLRRFATNFQRGSCESLLSTLYLCTDCDRREKER